eukprot:TRINITY_DN1082_c0_g1_i10.p2 TRINITY_DN1082_c0_g1~~TRINITY_DN1082_c0_g1_i10.p2  ORF type:complete len:119 (+),score=28.58 TRINITY_DN1082_c0_g1_i10:183-539(+)
MGSEGKERANRKLEMLSATPCLRNEVTKKKQIPRGQDGYQISHKTTVELRDEKELDEFEVVYEDAESTSTITMKPSTPLQMNIRMTAFAKVEASLKTQIPEPHPDNTYFIIDDMYVQP